MKNMSYLIKSIQDVTHKLGEQVKIERTKLHKWTLGLRCSVKEKSLNAEILQLRN